MENSNNSAYDFSVNKTNENINNSIFDRYMSPLVEEPINTLNPRQCQLYSLCPSTLYCDKREVNDWKIGKYISQDDIPFENPRNTDNESELLGLNNKNLAYCAPSNLNKKLDSEPSQNIVSQFTNYKIWNINTSPRVNSNCELC